MNPLNTIIYQIHVDYLIRLFILEHKEHIYTQVPQTHYMSAGDAGPHVVGVLDLIINVFLETQNK